ncbi:hypothetical protein [Amphritea pacifica]|uniref:DUF2384 domain-containing protein n=1 Tax=Amphritea pacifica TaxID=2811233 RepID=A0ABS2WDP0_9GAMM|nr:hypothetical protein [Amphritea pacifica]MBN0989830.1 hypothetical protein [Amphritea pacifica]
MNDNGYLGDKAWQNFAKLFEKKWSEFERKDELLALVGGDEMLAMVVSQVSLDPEQWLSAKVPALQGKSPIWCVKNGREKQLKAILMNMPR